jgi:2-oxoglutarate ferredoxin oxidoreductase subunit beta
MVPLVSLNPKIDPKRWKTTPYGMTENTLDPIAQAIAWDVSFVARGFSYKPNQLTDLLTQAIQHKGFSLVDVFSPCPTFNSDQTEEYYKTFTYDVPEDHDPTNRAKAFELALARDGFPVGLIYKHEDKPNLLEEQEYLRRRFDPANPAPLAALFKKFR